MRSTKNPGVGHCLCWLGVGWGVLPVLVGVGWKVLPVLVGGEVGVLPVLVGWGGRYCLC